MGAQSQRRGGQAHSQEEVQGCGGGATAAKGRGGDCDGRATAAEVRRRDAFQATSPAGGHALR
eukprot:703031-Heterocapsa_arctica.AAC.1